MERSPDQRLQAVRHAVESVHDDPAAALAVALGALSDVSDHSLETTVTAEWAAGLAQRDLGELDEAAQHLLRGVSMAADGGLSRLEGNIRSSLALVHAYRGHTDAALAEAGYAIGLLDGPDRARVEMQQALVHQRLGDLTRAIAGYDRALPALQASEDRVAEIRLRVNRGLAHAYRGAFGAAIADMEHARGLALRHDQRHMAAGSAHNLGFVYGRRGDVPEALRWFDRAAAEFKRLGVAPEVASSVLSDRAETLLRAGLTAEALTTATRALAVFDGGANVVEEAEARLLVARAALADRDLDRASLEGRRAAEAFAAQHRDGWVVRAEHVVFEAAELEVDVGTGGQADRPGHAPDPAPRAHSAIALASRLEAHGWAEAGASLRIRAATLLQGSGQADHAREVLAAVPSPDEVVTAAHRTLAWHARALGHVLAGERGHALEAIAEGLAVVDAYRATLSATDLRVRASGLGAGLAALGLRLAVEADDVAAMLRWAEAWKAGNLIAGRRADAVAGLGEVLAHARALQADLRRASAQGEDTAPLRRRLVALEEQVRDRTRTAESEPGAAPVGHGEFDVSVVAGRSEGVLVEYVVVDGGIHAVWFRDGTMRHGRCGLVTTATREIRSARLSLHRLAHGVGTPASLAHAGATLATALHRLDEQLLAPLRLAAPRVHADAQPVTVVPTGPLHAVPWSGLPTLWDRATTVTPSLRMWLTGQRPHGPEPTDGARRPLVVAGPGLPGAVAEVDAVGGRWPDADVVTGARAGVAAVLERLNTASVAHIAAHGRLRADNPQFSALTLADGDLTVYDLERLDHVPTTLILSACEVGASVVHPGDELLGVAATLLAGGARSVIAPSVPVPDDTTVDLMVRLHGHLAAGAGPAASLTRARMAIGPDDHRGRAVASSFVCLGVGRITPAVASSEG